MLVPDPFPGPRINRPVAGNRDEFRELIIREYEVDWKLAEEYPSHRSAMFLELNVEPFPVGRFGRLLELPTAAELQLQLAAGGVEELDDFEAVVRTLVATAEYLAQAKARAMTLGVFFLMTGESLTWLRMFRFD
jgi:hypothetical protein